MCVVCGCGKTAAHQADGDQTVGGPAVDPTTGDLHFGAGPARVSVPGMSAARAIRLEADVLGENNRIASANRAHFRGHGVTALNLVSSPGSGKTSLLVATLTALQQRQPALALGVIEGDQQTANDANRIRATGVPAIQVNTGKGCHLDAPMVAQAFARLPLHDHGHAHDPAHAHDHSRAHEHSHEHSHEHPHEHSHDPSHEHSHVHPGGHGHAPAHGPAHDATAAAPAGALLFIENVGNLVCPALWDLGEAAKVVVLSVTEGEDKPLKYPDMFAAARLMVLSKVDLLPHVDFDVERCVAYARQVHPGIEVLLLSSRSGTGMEAWLDWLLALRGPADAEMAASRGETEALRQRVAELEKKLHAAGLAV
jgi:hydrogenase nickel incorporation protein HypB